MDPSDSGSPPPSLEELSMRSATALLPWIIGMAAAANSSSRHVAVLLHPSTQSITIVEGFRDLESLLHEISSKEGPLPASKASIDSLPVVQVSDPGMECPICLVEYEVNGEAQVKEMPCRHRFHSSCIDKWLGIHGSCPVCRYSMPEEEEREGEETEGSGWTININLFLGRERMEPGMDAGQDSDNSNESPAQEMDIDNID